MDKVIAVLPTGEWAELGPGDGVYVFRMSEWEVEELRDNAYEDGAPLGAWVRNPNGELVASVTDREGQVVTAQAPDPLNTGTGPVHIVHRGAVYVAMIRGEVPKPDTCLCHPAPDAVEAAPA